jgi:hypothetical protein
MKIISIIFLFFNLIWSQENPCEKLYKSINNYDSSPVAKQIIDTLNKRCKDYVDNLHYGLKKIADAEADAEQKGSSRPIATTSLKLDLIKDYPEMSNDKKKPIKKAKISFMDALNDTLVMINQNMSKMLIKYNTMIDLKRNILKSRLENARMSFVYHKPKRNYNVYKFWSNDRVKIKKLSDEMIKVFPDRFTRGNGEQYILIQFGSFEEISPLTGFVNYKKIKKELPNEFVDIVEASSFKDYKKIKDLTNNIEKINSDEMDRWLQVTAKSYEEEIKAKSLKSPNQNFRSIVLNTIVVLLFILNLSVI